MKESFKVTIMERRYLKMERAFEGPHKTS
jgi:hypothetical protein